MDYLDHSLHRCRIEGHQRPRRYSPRNRQLTIAVRTEMGIGLGQKNSRFNKTSQRRNSPAERDYNFRILHAEPPKTKQLLLYCCLIPNSGKIGPTRPCELVWLNLREIVAAICGEPLERVVAQE